MPRRPTPPADVPAAPEDVEAVADGPEPAAAPEPIQEPEVEPEAEAGPRTVGRFIADALRAAGVRYAFTVPGESFLGLLDVLEDAGIRVIATRHEGPAVVHGRGARAADRSPGRRPRDARRRWLEPGHRDPHRSPGLDADVRRGRADRARVSRPRGVPGDRPGRIRSAVSPNGPPSRAARPRSCRS